MSGPHLHVLATGGTIAGRGGSPTRRDYRPGQIGIDEFLARIEPLALGARLTGEQVANIGSEDISYAVWARLHASASAALDDPAVDGLIITHGTDTAEETALLLDRTLPTSKPIVLVGAMRAADAVGSDGWRNFANAVQVARDPAAAGRGVLVVMGDLVHAARDVRKAITSGTGAFRSFPRGPVAAVTPTSLEWFADPWRVGAGALYPFPAAMPEVALIHCCAGLDGRIVALHRAAGAQGFVVAGFGEGTMPEPLRAALRDVAAAGLPVVRATRVDEGLVDRAPDDDGDGFIAARALGPAKARILLQVLIAAGVRDPAAIQQAFEAR